MTGKDHANLLGIFAYIFAGIQFLITLFFGLYVLLMGGLGLMIALGGKAEDAGGVVMMFVFAALFGLLCAVGLASVAMNIKMGRRLRSDSPPTQRSVMITSIINCCSMFFGGIFSMPFGAAIGVYGIWFAASDVGKRFFDGHPEPEIAYLNPPPVQNYAQSYTPENEPYKWR